MKRTILIALILALFAAVYTIIPAKDSDSFPAVDVRALPGIGPW